MPFATLPSSPGFVAPTAPDWGRFAELAIQQIQHGGDIRAQAGKDLISQMDKSFEQVSKIMQMQSPEYKAARRLQLLKLKYQSDLFDQYSNNPSDFITTINGPVHKNSYEGLKFRNGLVQQALGIRHLLNSVKKQEAPPPDDPRTPYEKAAGLPPTRTPPDANEPDAEDDQETRNDLNPDANPDISGISIPQSEQPAAPNGG